PMSCSARMESSAAMGPGPVTICAWLSGASETVKVPVALALTVLRLMAALSTRLVLLISMGPTPTGEHRRSWLRKTCAQGTLNRALSPVIRMPGQDGHGSVNLFQKQHPGQKMRPGLR